MTGRRIGYLCCLVGSVVFYFCYQLWFAWILLLVVAGLPWISLVLSLPAMLQFRAEVDAPAFVTAGEPAHAALWGLSELPQPRFLGTIQATNRITGDTWRHDPRKPLPTDHCGSLLLTAGKVRICDYLGLFTLPVKGVEERTVIIRPAPLAVETQPDLTRYIARSWRPKFGGGYAENHELRLYRPGDSLNQVHWKLSAKTGELILREPMEPDLGPVLLTMDLCGSPEELDLKFGRLLNMSRALLEIPLRHEIHVLTADGPVAIGVGNEAELTAAVDKLLCCPAAKSGSILDVRTAAGWQYHVGGDRYDA